MRGAPRDATTNVSRVDVFSLLDVGAIASRRRVTPTVSQSQLLCAPTVVHSQTPRELPTCGYMGFCTYMVCIPGVCMYPMEFPIGAP